LIIPIINETSEREGNRNRKKERERDRETERQIKNDRSA
jgi:hypothetical protein